jgi:hypothetical protein
VSALRVKTSTFDVPRFASNLREIARCLGAAVEGDGELQSQLVGLLEQEDMETRVEWWNRPECVMLESLWYYCHQNRDRVHAKEIAKTFKAILLGRGEKIKFNPREVSPKLKLLGLRTTGLDNRGRGLRLTNSLRRRVHKLAKAHGIRALESREPGCALCAELLAADRLGPGEQRTSEHEGRDNE